MSAPHIESSDSKKSDHVYKVPDIANSDSDDEIEHLSTHSSNVEFNSVEEPEMTCVEANGIKFYTPKCDVSKTPYANQQFTTIEEAYVFHRGMEGFVGSTCIIHPKNRTDVANCMPDILYAVTGVILEKKT